MRAQLLCARGHDPWQNLALEEYLMRRAAPDALLLYLWQNDRTVVIGRNQDAFAECDVAALEGDGGRLARRASGGGAVYQDLGNLNFTFIAPPEEFDVPRQLEVVLRAVRALGIEAEATGRNDLTAGGRKFSGNAFRRTAQGCVHHGTLMVDVDEDALARYLLVGPEKLRGKGVASVRSRVTNLRALSPSATVEGLSAALCASFSDLCGALEPYPAQGIDRSALGVLQRKYASRLWRYGEAQACTHRLSHRFPWGGVELRLTVADGTVQCCRVYSDALDEAFIASLPGRLTGCAFARGPLCGALAGEGAKLGDLRRLIAEEDWAVPDKQAEECNKHGESL